MSVLNIVHVLFANQVPIKLFSTTAVTNQLVWATIIRIGPIIERTQTTKSVFLLIVLTFIDAKIIAIMANIMGMNSKTSVGVIFLF